MGFSFQVSARLDADEIAIDADRQRDLRGGAFEIEADDLGAYRIMSSKRAGTLALPLTRNHLIAKEKKGCRSSLKDRGAEMTWHHSCFLIERSFVGQATRSIDYMEPGQHPFPTNGGNTADKNERNGDCRRYF